jgi:CHASE3 domain sensor protein
VAFTPVQKLSIGTGAALSLVALVGLVSYLSITQMIGGERAVAAANANIARIDRVGARTVDAENAQRGFVSTGDTLYLPAIELAQSDVEFALDSLRTATEDHPSQRQNLDRVSQLVATRFRELRMAVSVRQRSGLDSAAKVLKAERAVRARDGVGPLLNRMRDEELVVLGERTRVMTDRGVAASNFILVGSFLALILAAIALQPLRPSVSRRLTQRLSQVMLPPLPELQLTMNEAARHAGDRLSRLQQVVAAMNGRVSASEVAGALLMRGARAWRRAHHPAVGG